MIEWFARNSVAANLLMFGIVILGLYSATNSIPLETFPSFERDAINIRTMYRGSTPQSVEDAITTRIEEAIYDLEGIDEINSISSEGASLVVADVTTKYNKRNLLNDIKLRVDSLNTLPGAAEKPIVSLATYNPAVIDVVVTGDIGIKSLRQTADKVRDDLLSYDEITLAELQGVADYEISIEILPFVLENYKLTLADVGQAIQRGSVDLSAGNIKTRDGDILIRTDGQAYTAQEYAQIPVIANLAGKPILLGDIANIEDGFEEKSLITMFNGKPAVILKVMRVGDQSAIKVADRVHQYIADSAATLPTGVNLEFWDDDSQIVRDRLSTLMRSGIQGGILVLLLLSLFLRPAIAFWVFLGVPVAFMGAFIFMPFVGGSFNIISLFAFITVLGIVVDDAIVTGENIYRKMRNGEDSLTASIVGTKEIAVPVTFGILTTVVAFYPLSTMQGTRMAFIAQQIPMVVIPILIFSLIESKFVLPAHLSHIAPRSEDDHVGWFGRMQMKISRALENYVIEYQQPFLLKCLHNKAISIAILLSISAIILTYAMQGHIRFTFFPRVQAETVRFNLTMPDTTGFETTKHHINGIAGHFEALREKYRDPQTGNSIIQHIYTTVGSSGRTKKPSVGAVQVEIMPLGDRTIDISAKDVASEVRRLVGQIPGAEKLSVRAEIGRGKEPIDVQLSGADVHRMGDVVGLLRQKLKQYPNVFDIQDNYTGGKEELNILLKPQAHSLGLSLVDVARQVRYAVFGFEAQRIQRGRDELRVMVRYPLSHRSSLEDLYKLPIKVTGSTTEIPLSDIAIIEPTASPTSLYRQNRTAILDITADIDKDKADMPAIMRDLRLYLDDILQGYPDVKFAFKGEAEEQADSSADLARGALLILVAIYALLAIPFKSYGQPLIVMSIIPFSLVGAVLGHIIMGYDLSFLSLIGMLALIGVVVNDSLVLVDYINKKRREGMDVMEAALASGVARFRPVILTSLTTFAGLTPLLLEQSTQAKFLAQMAISLGFGILFATLITLIIVPINYVLAYQARNKLREFWNK